MSAARRRRNVAVLISTPLLLGGCAGGHGYAPVPGAGWMPPPDRFAYQGAPYGGAQRVYPPPQTYAANNRAPIPLPPPPSLQDRLAPYAEGAAVGAVGGMMAGRAMAAREVGGQVAKGGLPGEARAVAKETETAAARAATARTAAVRAGTVGASEAATAGRTVGAAGAGAATVGAAEAAGGRALIGRALSWTVRRSWIGLAVLTAGEIFLHERKNDER